VLAMKVSVMVRFMVGSWQWFPSSGHTERKRFDTWRLVIIRW